MIYVIKIHNENFLSNEESYIEWYSIPHLWE